MSDIHPGVIRNERWIRGWRWLERLTYKFLLVLTIHTYIKSLNAKGLGVGCQK